MAITTLSLPIDIPWKRLAVSEDMYAPSEDAPLPVKWHTSLAVFFFVPEPDPTLSNPDEITTFLKVVASVSGFQPQGDEIDTVALTGSPFSTLIVQNYDQLTNQYYPCLSALLQVAVFPADGDFAIGQFPYLTDFEPKKREIVELVSDTGEALTQSSNNLNVRKGTTSTDSIEIANIDRGGSVSGNVTVNTPEGGGGGGFTVTHNQEVGTRSNLGTQAVNLVTTDASREKRESFSHTTNLSQLYQLLDSYHSGTNRAIFFLNARPHIVDSPFTFVNGPRRLEGVQEFFLVVRRPKEMDNFCVKAVLETAHLHESDVTVTQGTTVFDKEQVTQSFSLHANGGHFSADDTPGAFTIQVPAGFTLDRSRGGGPFSQSWANGHVDSGTNPAGVTWSLSGNTEEGHESQAIPTFAVFDDHIDFTVHIFGIQNLTSPEDANMTWTVTVFTISVDPIQTPTTTVEHHVDLFITAREVRGCTHIEPAPATSPPTAAVAATATGGTPAASISTGPYVAYEKALGPTAQAQLAASKATGKDAEVAANTVTRVIKDEMVTSFRPGKRYVAGAIDFVHTAFAVRDLLNGVTAPTPPEGVGPPIVGRLAAASPAMRAKVDATMPNVSAHEILRTPAEKLATGAGISLREARELKLNAAGVALHRGAPSAAEKAQRPDGRSSTATTPSTPDKGPRR
jgi:hypothetical protein